MRSGVFSRLVVAAVFWTGLSGCHLFAGAPCSTQNDCSLTEQCVDGFCAFLQDTEEAPALSDAGGASRGVDAGKFEDGGNALDGGHQDAAEHPHSTLRDGGSWHDGGLSRDAAQDSVRQDAGYQDAGALADVAPWGDGGSSRDAGELSAIQDSGFQDDGFGGDAGAPNDAGLVCPDGMHIENGTCFADERDCTIENGAGQQQWTEGTWSHCLAVSCESAFHIEDNACVLDQRECQVAFGSGTQTWSSDVWGPCVVQVCDDMHHIQNDVCVSDTRACYVENGFGVEIWTDGSWRPCIPIDCESDHHIEDIACVSDTRACVVSNGVGTQRWSSGDWGVCFLVACNHGYHQEAEQCASNARGCEVSNGFGVQTWEAEAWTACVLSGCDADYHLEDGACISDERVCAVMNGWGYETWSNGIWGGCVFEECGESYHLDNGRCISNQRICDVTRGVGQQRWDGTSWSGCVATCMHGFEKSEATICTQSPYSYLSGPAGMPFAQIPAGTFTMGSPASEIGHHVNEVLHEVTITRAFAMGVTEVTQSEWRAFSNGINPSNFSDCGPDCPVENVDWFSTLAYANALSEAEGLDPCYSFSPASCAVENNTWWNGDTVTGRANDCTDASFVGLACTGYRLPTEAEWEYAYRAGTTTAFFNGENTQFLYEPDENLNAIAWYYSNAAGVTHAVAGKLENPWGLYDMSGNVSEWVWDWRGDYPGTVTDYLGPEERQSIGLGRILRGGAWNNGAKSCRAASRNDFGPQIRGNVFGFRLARTLTGGTISLPLASTGTVGIDVVDKPAGINSSCDFPGEGGIMDGDGFVVADENFHLSTSETSPVGDYTLEAFIKIERPAGTTEDLLVLGSNITDFGIAILRRDVDGSLRFESVNVQGGMNSAMTISADAYPVGEWFHYAISKAGNVNRVFINGEERLKNTVKHVVYVDQIYVGAALGNTFHRPLDGKVSNLRLSGVTRYPSDFIPPAADFQMDEDTLLLTCQGNVLRAVATW